MKAIFTLAMTTAMTAAAFAGDTEDIPEMASIKDIGVAFLPCNQPYTMTPEQVSKANQPSPNSFAPFAFFLTTVASAKEVAAKSYL